VEFSDFKCPYCRMSAFQVRPFLQEFRDEVRLYYVNYPLDPDCNGNVKQRVHPDACLPAKAGVCAHERGGFWPFHDELFRGQGRQDALRMAAERGWDTSEFRACLDAPQTLARVRSDAMAGAKAGVEGTPTLFLDGRKLKGWRDPKLLRRIIREELRRG
jgi:protein-disulfide isomerase